jgi:hypothetical protein
MTHLLYDGAIKANKIGAFVAGGEQFHVIRPGYDIQGKRRTTWTQVVHEDIPIFQVKLSTELRNVMEQFDAQWARTIGDDPLLLQKALTACKNEHRRKFKDGVSGEAPAATISRDGRNTGLRYPT